MICSPSDGPFLASDSARRDPPHASKTAHHTPHTPFRKVRNPARTSRHTFQLVRDLLKGKNRRTKRLTHALANGLFLCEYCGRMVTGERIRRPRKDSSHKVHMYYRCANNKPGPDHPRVRWREADLEDAVCAELDTMRMPDDETRQWFRDTLHGVYEKMRGDHNHQKRALARKKAEVEKQSQRLLELYLEGHVDAGTFQDKSTALQGHLRELEEGLTARVDIDPSCMDIAEKVFEFIQNAPDTWRRSNPACKQRILRQVSLNRTLGDVSVDIEKRKPFSFLTERLPVRTSRGDWR